MSIWKQFAIVLGGNIAAGAFFVLVAGFPLWPVVGVSGFIWIISFVIAAIMQEL